MESREPTILQKTCQRLYVSKLMPHLIFNVKYRSIIPSQIEFPRRISIQIKLMTQSPRKLLKINVQHDRWYPPLATYIKLLVLVLKSKGVSLGGTIEKIRLPYRLYTVNLAKSLPFLFDVFSDCWAISSISLGSLILRQKRWGGIEKDVDIAFSPGVYIA